MRFFLIFLLVSGCGSDDGGSTASVANPLYGDWLIDGNICARGLILKEDGGYRSGRFCLDHVNNIIETQETSGLFEADQENLTITFTPQKSSCPDIEKSPLNLNYVLSQDNLTLKDGSSILSYSRWVNDSSNSSGTEFVFGCFDEDGGFTKRDIADL